MAKFQKGNPGRQAGIPNKIGREIREIARGLFDAEYWQNTKARLLKGEVAPVVEKVLLAYAYGEPTKSIEVSQVPPEEKRGILKHLPDGMVEELAARAAFESEDTDEGPVN